MNVTMKHNLLIMSWFDIQGLRKNPWFSDLEVPPTWKRHSDGEPMHHVPSPVHECEDIDKARNYIHGLIEKEIKAGNYYIGFTLSLRALCETFGEM